MNGQRLSIASASDSAFIHGDEQVPAALPPWASWNARPGEPYTVGAEEEVMLLDRRDWSLAQQGHRVLFRLSGELAQHAAPETHAAVIELATGVHQRVGELSAELASLRDALACELAGLRLAGAGVGAYPLAHPASVLNSGSSRYQQIRESLRFLAQREPTAAMHVHVGVPDPDDAARAFNVVRQHVPLLLAVSANSPFCRGQDTGFASARTAIFHGFPRTGIAREFPSYAAYASAVDGLIRSGAVAGPTFIWWDMRLQPELGTVEVRCMDAQSTVADTTALVALVQSLIRLAVEDEPPGMPAAPEVLDENRFRAARDGSNATLIDPRTDSLVPVADLLAELIERCRPHAATLGCTAELEQVRRLASVNGADRQRARMRTTTDLRELVAALAAAFWPTTEPSASRKLSHLI